MKIYLCQILLFLSQISALAQPREKAGLYNPGSKQDLIRFEHFNDEKGLKSSLFKGPIKYDGFLWISDINKGLVRFDGQEFRYFDIAFRDKTVNANIFSMFVDSRGWLWLGATQDLYVCQGEQVRQLAKDGFVTQKLIVEKIKIPDSNQTIVSIKQDQSGAIWAVGSQGKIYRYEVNTKRSSTFLLPGSDQLSDMQVDKHGLIWILGQKEIFVFDPKTNKVSGLGFSKKMQFKDPGKFLTIVPENDGSFWIATRDDGVFLIKPRKIPGQMKFTFDLLKQFSCPHVQHIARDRAGRIWAGTLDEGIFIFDPSAETLQQLKRNNKDPDGLAENQVNKIYIDDQDIVWVVPQSAGLEKYDPLRYQFSALNYNPSNPEKSLPNNIINTLFGTKGQLFIATPDGVVCFSAKDKKLDRAVTKILEPLGNEITAIKIDRNGNIWFGDQRGVAQYDQQTQKLTFYPFLKKRFRTEAMFDLLLVTTAENETGPALHELWSVDWDGLSRFDINTKKWKTDTLPALRDISQKPITSGMQDISGDIWLGTGTDGIYKYDPVRKNVRIWNQTSRHFTYFPEFLEIRNSMWVSIAGTGVYEISKDDLKTISRYSSEKRDLPDKTISNILKDSQGFLWLSSGDGQLIKFLPGKGIIKSYNSREAFSSQYYFNDGFSHPDGTLYFGGNRGVTYFNPKDLKTNNFVPPVKITDVTVTDSAYSPRNGELELLHNQNFITFQFTALNFSYSDKNQYQYKMDGIDERWIHAGSKREANYTNLPPGEYTFRVIGSNNDGIWNKKGASIKITILPPWWGTWWFRTLLILLFAGGIFGLFRYRLSQQLSRREAEIRASLMAQEAERQRFSRELHDGIGANLSLLKMYLSSFGEADIPMAELKERAEKLLAGSVDEIRRLIHDMHPRNLKEMGLVNAVEDMVGLVNMGDGVKVIFNSMNVPEHLPEQVEINLFRIVQELLQNAMKHSRAENAWLYLDDYEEVRLILRYRDNGAGFEPSAKVSGNGLLNIQNRVTLLKGEIRIDSEKGKGTGIEISVPVL
ncbi:sensor histidine kinase [Dyadobacter arcticus]|uniref:histidine kinase n=1 Tax=Dyadobacter arcticus TaxID=1078754 RepID=A0ABX0ULD3_9BACT|nr:sensor histidine kinase [Dyadobacter arcticus]NIJ53809.1 signal transduction histidine kinase/ligand-binding sensor domain-containing protein [Dyadobacter arcticus]